MKHTIHETYSHTQWKLGLSLDLYFLHLAQNNSPTMMAFQEHLVDLIKVLPSHVEIIASSAYSEGLISADIYKDIILSEEKSPKQKVKQMLTAIQKSIMDKSESLLRFVDVLREQGSFLELMGNRLHSTFCEWDKIF